MSIPGSAAPFLLATEAAPAAYEIERSLRFNSSDSAYLSRSISTSGNRKTWTLSCWVKRSGLSTYQNFFGGRNGSTGFTLFSFTADNKLQYLDGTNTSSGSNSLDWSYQFRDPSAWYHIQIVQDTTQVTAQDRLKLYVNGSRVNEYTIGIGTGFPAQNFDGYVNASGFLQAFSYNNGVQFGNFYLADVHLIDGQALTPSSFGEFDTNNIWQPKAYSGTYGTNGFHLDFADNSTAAALGTDTSGNSNTWTVNNISVAAGSGNDSLVDTPTSYGTDTGAGGEVRGNYCTWNPLKLNTNGSLANGNLDWSSSTNGGLTVGTIGVSSGKWYWEVSVTSGANCGVGVFDPSAALTTYSSDSAKGIGYYGSSGSIFYFGGSSSYGSTFTTGDVIGVALDLDNGKIYFAKNGTWQNSGNPATQTNPARTGLSGTYAPEIDAGASSAHSASLNTGSRPFAYTAPSGFKALCTTNLPSTTITTSGSYTGNGVADGPFVYLNGVPTAMTVNGNAVTFGTHADKLSNGFKIRTTSTTYNQNASTYNYSITSTGDPFKTARAQSN